MMIRTRLKQLSIYDFRTQPLEDTCWICERCGHVQKTYVWYCLRCRCAPYVCDTCGVKTWRRADNRAKRLEKLPCPHGCQEKHRRLPPTEEESVFVLESTDVFELQRRFGGDVKCIGRGRHSYVYEWRTSCAKKLHNWSFLLEKDSKKFVMLIDQSSESETSVKLVEIPKELYFLLR